VAHWVERLNRAGVPAGPVLDLEQVFADPQVLAREMLVELPHPELGRFQTTGLPAKLSRSPGGIRRSPPLHGEHTEEVLLESGLTREEIAQLRRSEVI
jgi:crotonobetainyl-CoA:carnitine CoA-transferase CaiB-like acyl-CoA transferase